MYDGTEYYIYSDLKAREGYSRTKKILDENYSLIETVFGDFLYPIENMLNEHHIKAAESIHPMYNRPYDFSNESIHNIAGKLDKVLNAI